MPGHILEHVPNGAFEIGGPKRASRRGTRVQACLQAFYLCPVFFHGLSLRYRLDSLARWLWSKRRPAHFESDFTRRAGAEAEVIGSFRTKGNNVRWVDPEPSVGHL